MWSTRQLTWQALSRPFRVAEANLVGQHGADLDLKHGVENHASTASYDSAGFAEVDYDKRGHGMYGLKSLGNEGLN